MKTRLFSLIALLILTTAFAMSQDNGKLSFAVLGGANFQNLYGKDILGEKIELNLILGYHAGANVQIPIVPEFFFQPGLLFSTKGTELPEVTGLITNRLTYIELPLNVVYKGLLGKGYVMIGLGPYLGYGVAGKSIIDDEKLDIEFAKEAEAGNPNNGVYYYKALDVGGNLFAGYELANGIFFQLNTQLGMRNIKAEDKSISDDKAVWKNTGFGLSLGYRF